MHDYSLNLFDASCGRQVELLNGEFLMPTPMRQRNWHLHHPTSGGNIDRCLLIALSKSRVPRVIHLAFILRRMTRTLTLLSAKRLLAFTTESGPNVDRTFSLSRLPIVEGGSAHIPSHVGQQYCQSTKGCARCP